MERTPLPARVDVKHLRALVRQKREEGLTTITLMVDDVDSMIIECELYRNRYDSASRRQRDGAKVRRPSPPKITLDNVDTYDADPAGQ